ncbi:MAG: tetratricopeptide repeat protein [Gemmatimonadetes bacterium]|nr:tetratricopeptide repeat protein [Gemmatimonadota bacterium]
MIRSHVARPHPPARTTVIHAHQRAPILPLAAVVVVLLAACGDSGTQTRARTVGARSGGGTQPPVATAHAVSATTTMTEPVQPVIDREVSYTEAETAYQARRYDEAGTLFAAYTERRPENAWGHYMHGLSAWKAGDLETAETALGRALERNPEHTKALVNLGRVLLDRDRPEEARETVARALALEPESSDGLRVMGRALHELGRLDEAVEQYQRTIVSNDNDAWSMNNLGLLYIQQGRYEDALRPLARATELLATVALFWNNLGVALERTGHFTAAAEAYGKALAIDQSYEKASISLARVDARTSDPGLPPLDLPTLARRFEDEVATWRQVREQDQDPLPSQDSVPVQNPVSREDAVHAGEATKTPAPVPPLTPDATQTGAPPARGPENSARMPPR